MKGLLNYLKAVEFFFLTVWQKQYSILLMIMFNCFSQQTCVSRKKNQRFPLHVWPMLLKPNMIQVTRDSNADSGSVGLTLCAWHFTFPRKSQFFHQHCSKGPYFIRSKDLTNITCFPPLRLLFLLPWNTTPVKKNPFSQLKTILWPWVNLLCLKNTQTKV